MIIFLYTVSNCASCCKARVFLQQQGIFFEERDILKEPLLVEELSKLLNLAREMNESIIAPRFAVFSKLSVNFDEIKANELAPLINEYPKLLRRPLIVGENRMLIGFNENDIKRFISQVN